MAGKDGSSCECVDLRMTVVCADTACIQKCHITIGHILCELVETELSDNGSEV